MPPRLMLVVLYNVRKNEYTVTDHNLTPKEAERQIERYRAQDLTAVSLSQRAKHQTSSAGDCQTCHREVARAAILKPNPDKEG